MSTGLKCEELLVWAKKNPWFTNTNMIEDIADRDARGDELTGRQIEAIDDMYEKFVAESQRDWNNYAGVCEDLIDFAEDNSWFDDSFIQSMYGRLEEGKGLTDGQKAAITKIHKRFIKE